MVDGLVQIDDGALEVRDSGLGEPVVFIQTALATEELVPLGEQPCIRERFRVIHILRRGYGLSSTTRQCPSVEGDAADVVAVLASLGIPRAHFVGASYSAAVALAVAARHPNVVQTLTLLEPPPVGVADAVAFSDICEELIRLADDAGATAVVNALMTRLDGPEWRAAAERQQPGSASQMDRDAAAFVTSDLPALLRWSVTGVDVVHVTAPVLLVGGSDTQEWFAAMRSALGRVLPDVRETVIPEAGHLLAVSHPQAVAPPMAAHLSDHPIGA